MSGNDGRGVVIQERDRGLFRELSSVLRVADREMVKIVAPFRSTTRANARLLALTNAGLLKRFFLGGTAAGRKALYTLSAKSARLIDVPLRGPRRPKDRTLVADFFIEHQLAVNRLYCALKFGAIPASGVTFAHWKSFEEPLTPGLRLIPDGHVEFSTPSGALAAFLEVDLGHESLRVWKEKVRNYLQLAMSGEYERRFGNSRFRVAVIANSERRMNSIRSVVAPATEKIFWLAPLGNVHREGFFAHIWFRPRGDQPRGFIENP